MKKLYFALIMAVGCLLTACEPENYDRFKDSKDISGIWCLPLEGDTVTWYWELTSKNILTYYENYGSTDAVYKDQYIVNGTDTQWEVADFLGIRMSGAFEFDEVNQAIFFMGLQVGTVQRIGKDEALLESDLIQDGKIYRVKGIK